MLEKERKKLRKWCNEPFIIENKVVLVIACIVIVLSGVFLGLFVMGLLTGILVHWCYSKGVK